jgi:hypothetical protein
VGQKGSANGLASCGISHGGSPHRNRAINAIFFGYFAKFRNRCDGSCDGSIRESPGLVDPFAQANNPHLLPQGDGFAGSVPFGNEQKNRVCSEIYRRYAHGSPSIDL